MDEEIFRKYLIYLLKSSKLIYINSIGEPVTYYDLETKKNIEKRITEKVSENRKTAIMCNSLSFDEMLPKINYSLLYGEYEDELKMISNTKTMIINDDYSLEDIASLISRICEKEEYGYIDQDLKLYELKQANKGGLKGTLDYINKK